jgi:hypothetical protein
MKPEYISCIMSYVIIIVFLLLVGCMDGGKSENWQWARLKSPNTGKCYELASYGLGTQYGVAVITEEVPCIRLTVDTK